MGNVYNVYINDQQLLKNTPKCNIHQKKLMVSVLWSSAGVIHYVFMKLISSITIEVYCTKMNKINQPYNDNIDCMLHEYMRFLNILNTHQN